GQSALLRPDRAWSRRLRGVRRNAHTESSRLITTRRSQVEILPPLLSSRKSPLSRHDFREFLARGGPLRPTPAKPVQSGYTGALTESGVRHRFPVLALRASAVPRVALWDRCAARR